MRLSTHLIPMLAAGFLIASTPYAQTPSGQSGQTGQTTGQSGQTAQPTPPRTRPRATSAKLTVRDNSGTPIGDVQVAITGGGSSRSVTTDANGMATTMLDGGAYRLRFDRMGFITVERDITVQNGRTAEVDVVLDLAPPPPAPPPPVAPPPLPPKPEPAADAVRAPGPPVFVSIPEFLDKNYLGRDSLKESIVACTPSGVTRLLQLRDPLAEHTHANMDEVLYVIAGEGAVRIRAQSNAVAAGALSVIPRGVPHSVERSGKNPLILLSTLSGAPCPISQPNAKN